MSLQLIADDRAKEDRFRIEENSIILGRIANEAMRPFCGIDKENRQLSAVHCFRSLPANENRRSIRPVTVRERIAPPWKMGT